jgi:DNA-binding response OmpR family regulator
MATTCAKAWRRRATRSVSPNALEALTAVREREFDIVVLVVMMPRRDGITLASSWLTTVAGF